MYYSSIAHVFQICRLRSVYVSRRSTIPRGCDNYGHLRREVVDEIVLRDEIRRDRTGCSINRTLGG
jgi:hypothetical protein